MILFFEDVDNLLRTIHTGVRVEQRRVVGRIEHHVGTHLFGIGFDRGKNLFLDRLHRQNVTVQLLIFTKKNDPQLPRYIMEQLDRGVTSWTGRGGWTGDEVQVLCVCLSKYEIDTLQDVLRRVDPDAFYIVQEGVHAGGNFERHLG